MYFGVVKVRQETFWPEDSGWRKYARDKVGKDTYRNM